MRKKLFCEIFLSAYLLFAKNVSFYQVITNGYCHFDYCRSELHWGFNRNDLATEAQKQVPVLEKCFFGTFYSAFTTNSAL